jgi:hypothetical protein
VCFLGYSVEHKGNHCWDSVARRTQTSCDVVFDESRPFYLHPTTDASSIPPHFWAKVVSSVTYLINIQHSLVLQGGISFEHLCGKTLDYSSLRLFCCVCYVLLAPRKHTKLTT